MEYLTAAQAAEALHLSVPTIKRYIYEGRIKSAKLPGGQHRIPQSEINRLLSVGPTESDGAALGECVDAAKRVEVLERWIAELEAEVERLTATLEVLSSYCGRVTGREPTIQPAGEPRAMHEVLVLGGGCRRCDTLYELVRQMLQQSGATAVQLGRVTNPGEIAEFGPVLTPALAVDDRVVLSGRVPSRQVIRRVLGPVLN